MASRRKARRRSPTFPTTSDQQTVVVCRGGDCGSRTKHPGFDHSGQLQTLRNGIEAGTASVVTSKCLDACDHSNVIVVVPGTAGRSLGADSVWVGGVLDDDTTRELLDWVNAGGPALASEPVLVDLHTFRPSRLNRHELEEETGLS